MQTIKCVVVGDGAVGKAKLLTTYTNNNYIEELITTVFVGPDVTLMICGEPYRLFLCDTSGLEDYPYEWLRPLSYPQTDVFIMCFSIVDPVSFENAREKVTMTRYTYTCTSPSLLPLSLYPTQWYPEVTHHCPKTPIVLVGTHLELREDEETLERLKRQHKTPISYRQGLRLQKKMGAVKYVECSIRNLENVKNVFNEAILAGVTDPESFSICPICKKKIKAFCQEAVFCKGACNAEIHRKCAKLSKSEFERLSSTDEPFHCPHCRNSMKQQDNEVPQPSLNNVVAHNTASTAGVGKTVRGVLMQPFHKIASIPRIFKTLTTTTTMPTTTITAAAAAPSSDCEPSPAEQPSEEQTVLNDPRDVLGKVLIYSV